MEIRISFAKEAFNIKIPLLTSKLNIEVRKNLIRCYVCSIALYGSETWTPREVFGELQCVMLEENGENKMVRESN